MSYQETIEVPSMDELNALASDVAALKAQLGAFQNLQGWLAFITDAKACGKRADELKALTVQAIEALATLEAGKTEWATARSAQEAELAARARAVVDREDAVQIREESVTEREARIGEASALVERQTDLLKSRLMNFAGIVQHPLQDDFSFEVVVNMLRGARDVHYDSDQSTPRARDHDMTDTQEPENLVLGSTLTRSKPRRGVERRVT
jgi:hypothetical protein